MTSCTCRYVSVVNEARRKRKTRWTGRRQPFIEAIAQACDCNRIVFVYSLPRSLKLSVCLSHTLFLCLFITLSRLLSLSVSPFRTCALSCFRSSARTCALTVACALFLALAPARAHVLSLLLAQPTWAVSTVPDTRPPFLKLSRPGSASYFTTKRKFTIIQIFSHTYTYTYIHLHTHALSHAHTNMKLCIHVYICIHLYIYIYI